MTAKDSTDAENVEIEIQYSETVDHELIRSLSVEIDNQLNAPGKTRLIRQRSLDILLRQASTSAAPFTTTNLVMVPPIATIVIGSVAPLLLLLGYHYLKARIIERAKIDAQNANERRKQKSTPFVTKLSVLRHADVSISIDLHMEKKYIGSRHLKGKTEEAIRDELYVFLRQFDGQE